MALAVFGLLFSWSEGIPSMLSLMLCVNARLQVKVLAGQLDHEIQINTMQDKWVGRQMDSQAMS